MDRREVLMKMEDPLIHPSSSLDYFPLNSGNSMMMMTGEMLDQYCVDGEMKSSSSLGFMELLNMQDFVPPLVFDGPQLVPQTTLQIQNHTSKEESQLQESSEVLNAPATPNSSSVSSESCGGRNTKETVVGDGDVDDDDEDEPEGENPKNRTTKKQLKVKKTNEKKQRQSEPRFAFMTKSEVDHLEDGYRWRKYGQKAVKNSPFPRSYYRCTSASCNVKKMVERSFNDPSVVVTTYEGQHIHPSPLMPRSTPPYPAFSASNFSMQMLSPSHHQYQLSADPLNYGYVSSSTSNCTINIPSNGISVQMPWSLLPDHGLLQDMVTWPSSIKNEE